MNRLEILLARLKNNQILDPDLKLALSIILKDRLHGIDDHKGTPGIPDKTDNAESIGPKVKGLRKGIQGRADRGGGEDQGTLREGE